MSIWSFSFNPTLIKLLQITWVSKDFSKSFWFLGIKNAPYLNLEGVLLLKIIKEIKI